MGAGVSCGEDASVESRRTAQRAAGRRATREELGRSKKAFILDLMQGSWLNVCDSHLGGAATAKAEEGVWRWGGGRGLTVWRAASLSGDGRTLWGWDWVTGKAGQSSFGRSGSEEADGGERVGE